MSTKIIAIGNRLMQDDGVAIFVGERMKELFKENKTEIIIGETDIEYCLQQIKLGDDIYIIDSTYYGIVPGSITFSKLNSGRERKYISGSMHGFNLIDMIYIYRKKVNVYFIGIEIASIDMEEGLSSALNSKIDDICNNIIKLIQ